LTRGTINKEIDQTVLDHERRNGLLVDVQPPPREIETSAGGRSSLASFPSRRYETGRKRRPATIFQSRCGMVKEGMDKTIRKFTSLADMKAEEYRYWQSRPVHERVAAVSELTQEQYEMKGLVCDVPRLQRTLVRFERTPS